ncbi:InlB B-repeat-containing protein, partial [Candidatus Bathycorpusculum sp.]|uniref:InlB B-repeat-containing protein n=1 Tax=Candidatus Bathycorpusculum sp. TaxID=2994959 RepID=UPI00281D51F8|nr:InlB B-repeat-containing protein [Candidatus Termitimicrobium sp.]
LGHDLSSVTVDATCLVAGSVTTTCSRCDYEDVEVLAALGHDFSILIGHKDPTCEDYGYDRLKCSRCDRTITSYISPLGHNWSEWTVTKEPTCEEEGEETQICLNDSSHIQIRPIPKLDCYTVIYAPGDFGTWDAENNTYKHLLYGDATPDFKEDPYTNHISGWTFIGWDPVINTTVSCSVTYTAQWEQEELIVEFKDWNGYLLKSEKVLYGNNATAPPNPTRAGYSFTGWDTSFINVTSNLVVTAQYTQITQTNGSSSSSSSSRSSSSSSSSSRSSSNTDMPNDDVEYSDTKNSSLPVDIEEPLVMWAFVNLALSIAGIILLLIAVIGVLLKQKSENSKTKQNVAGHGNSHSTVWLVVMLALSVAGIVVFLLTQNLQGSMVMTDNWTIVNAIIFVVEIIPIALIFKSKKSPN